MSNTNNSSSNNNNKYIPPHLRRKSSVSDKQSSFGKRSSLQDMVSSLEIAEIGRADNDSTRPVLLSSRASSLRSPRRSSSSTSSLLEGERVAFFGDSFIRLFGLLNPDKKDPHIHLHAFKGASARGLGRPHNSNRDEIRRVLSSHNFDRAVFCFGSVDVHLSYYYKTYIKKEPIDFTDIAKHYVDFVASLGQRNCLIVGVYGSALEDKDVLNSLVNYGVLTPNDTLDIETTTDFTLRARQNRVFAFNVAVERYAAKQENIEYLDGNDEMLDKTTLVLKDAYRDVSDHNIHVVWETTLLLWLERLPWLKKLAPVGLETQMKESLVAYLKTKTWAERSVDAKPLHEFMEMSESSEGNLKVVQYQ